METNLAVVWGAREATSLIGILITAGSSWYYARKWDEEGALAYEATVEQATGADYSVVDEEGRPIKKFVTHMDGSRDAISVSTEDNREDPIVVPPQALEAAIPIPHAMIVGLFLWTISFLFLPAQAPSPYAGWNMIFVVFLPAMTVLFAFHIRKTTIERNLEYKKKAICLVFVMSIFLVLAGILDAETGAPWYFCFFGAILLFVSYHTMRRSRKMGISWERDAKPSSDIAAHNFGALSLILGYYLIWVGTNAIVLSGYAAVYVPIYLGYRAWFAFIAAFFIVIPSSVVLDFAFEKGSQPVPLAFGNLYKLDGRICREIAESLPYFKSGLLGDFIETPWPLLFGWILFGFCSFMPFGTGISWQKAMTFLICCFIGTVYTARLLPAYWNREVQYKTWTYAYYAGMVSLCISMGVGGQGTLLPSMLGTFLVVLGQHVELFEKKKGKHWIQHGEENPRAEVAYGIGHPMNVAGWLLLCVGMSIPMM